MELFNAIPKLGFNPDLMSYNNIIWSVGHLGRVDQAKKLFASIPKATSLKPNIYTFGALMHAFARSKDYKQALTLLDTMTQQGITPNQVRATLLPIEMQIPEKSFFFDFFL